MATRPDDLYINSLARWTSDDLKEVLISCGLMVPATKLERLHLLQRHYKSLPTTAVTTSEHTDSDIQTAPIINENIDSQSDAPKSGTGTKPKHTNPSQIDDSEDKKLDFTPDSLTNENSKAVKTSAPNLQPQAGTLQLLSVSDTSSQIDELEELNRQIAVLEAKNRIKKLQYDLTQPARADNSNTQSAASQPSSENQSNMNEMLHIMKKSAEINMLTHTKPPMFDGNPLDFPRWKTAFNLRVEQKDFTNAEKMCFLEQHLSGKALSCVKGFFMLTSDPNAFTDAMEMLEERFGCPYMIADGFRKRLESWSKIPHNNGEKLMEYADFLRQCKIASTTMHQLHKLDDPKEIKAFAQKLPQYLITKYSSRAGDYKTLNRKYPPFSEFADFVFNEARNACDSNTSVAAILSAGKPTQPTKTTKDATVHNTSTDGGHNPSPSKDSTTSSKSSSSGYRAICHNCPDKTNHITADCRDICKMSKPDLEKFISAHKLCSKCLRKSHQPEICPTKRRCKICKKEGHCTFQHIPKQSQPKESTQSHADHSASSAPEAEKSVISLSTGTDSHTPHSSTTMILPVYVSTADNPSCEHLTYALVDSQSNTSFISADLADNLSGSRENVKIRISTMTAKRQQVLCQKFSNLVVRGTNSKQRISIPSVFTQDTVPCNRKNIPSRETASQWPHLKRVANKLSPILQTEVQLLIGFNCSAASLPLQIIRDKQNLSLPYAIETVLGWSIIGGADNSPSIAVSHKIVTEEISTEDILNRLEEDLSVSHNQQPTSQDDLHFLKIMKSGTKIIDGRYTMPLPFKSRPQLPNNRQYAMSRFNQLQRKLTSNPTLETKYHQFMTDMLSKNEAELVTDPSKPGWYIPHHGVFHPHKPDKLRVVFDCSASYKGQSLNNHLIQGPDLNNNLTGLLSRFRKNPVAVTFDLQSMYHQFRVNEDDRDYLRFLWYAPNSQQITDYHMNVHLFGATSSPSCAINGLHRIADDHSLQYPDAAKLLHNNFYVDDCLFSVPTPNEAIQMVKDATALCGKGKLNLHKFSSNSSLVAKALNFNTPTTKEITSEKSNVTRTLGMCWDVVNDQFYFMNKEVTQPLTRRGVLSTVASVFDPLGLLTPYVLKGKLLLQELCQQKLNWDDSLSTSQMSTWKTWISNLDSLPQMRIPRCYIQTSPHYDKVELHTFSDASTLAYGVCSYLRLINTSTHTVSVSLVQSKSRVAPKKPVTIPRLELQAATLAVKVGDFLTKELQYDNLHTYYWSDSQSVLGYINNDARRFHTFVSNRVQRIRDSTDPSQWNYISTSENPADAASRGLYLKDFPPQWFNGPSFLQDPDFQSTQASSKTPSTLDPDDVEIRKVFCHDIRVEISQKEELLQVFDKCGSWSKAINVMRCLLKFQPKYKTSTPNPQDCSRSLIKLLQQVYLSEEIEMLKAGKVNKGSKLYDLDPFIDNNDLLRVGGRLKNSLIGDEFKHPVIIPSKTHLTTLFIRHVHVEEAHQGRLTTMNGIRRRGFHLAPQGLRAVSTVINNCVRCRRLRGRPVTQKMADLPEARSTPAPLFTNTGMDVFGPFRVKDGRKESKRYGLIFTCLASRAIHIEMLEDLSTDAFIIGLRCFLSIRGPSQNLYCDQGTNFVGAANEFAKSLQELEQDRIQQYLNCQQCTFHFNPPAASHFGGSWERMIRTVRNILNGILIEQHSTRLNSTGLRALFYECMNIANNRPLTTDSVNQKSINPAPLTPNMLLTSKLSPLFPPPGKFEADDLYSRKLWRRIQSLSEQFWKRWRVEYLQSLQKRQKWKETQRNLQPDDLVLIIDENLPRNDWRRGLVSKVHPSSDHLVRKVTLHIGNGQYMDRPVHKLVLLTHQP